MKSVIRSICLACFILLGVYASYAFDIAVYFDARSGVNWRSQNPDSSFCWDTANAPRDVVLSRIGSANEQQVFDWFHEMGITHIITYYPFSSDLTDLHSRELHGMKILNASYPGEAFKYLEAQDRNVFCGNRDSSYVDRLVSWNVRIDTSVQRTLSGMDYWVLEATADSADTMWRPESDLGVWNGWNRREAGISQGIYMPMHYVITCNLVPTNPPPPSGQSIATFYWLVKNTEGAGWWRYPAQVLMAGDFRTSPDSLDVFEINFTPSPGSGTFVLLDDSFQPTVTQADSHSYGTLDETLLSQSHAFGSLWGVPVRMCVYYHGDNQTFQIYNISIWDEGYDRLFKAADWERQYWKNALTSAFSNQRTSAGGDTTFAGWYYDEWPQGSTMWQTEMLEPWTRVNQILNQAGLPAMWLNGQFGWPGCTNCYRNLVFKTGQDYGVTCPVHMDEFYFLGGRRTCSGTIQYMYTNPNSDADYFHLIENSGNLKVIAEKSLQCAIDGYIWGWPTILANYNVPVDSDWLDVGTHLSMLEQISFVHDSSGGSKFWAMIQGDDDVIGDSLDPNGGCVIRRPTPEECKLSAWLSVAMDADGILWYPVYFAAGLLKWENDFADTCGNPNGLQHQSSSVETTDRYFAAKEVCNEIKRVAPILENLDFVKTYSSRAFETDYPDSTFEATQLDVLATNTTWYGQNFRSVDRILAWAPDTSRGGFDWSTTEETHPYVQVSRFRNPSIPLNDPAIEDYWFLIVNRRAQEHEQRKIRLVMEIDTAFMNYPYYIDYILGDSTRMAKPCAQRLPACANRFIDVILQPGEAELVHFFRGEFGCETTLAHIQHLTIVPDGSHHVRLNWEAITQTDEGDSCRVEQYFISGSKKFYPDTLRPIGVTETTTFVDSIFAIYPVYYYQVQACGTIIE